MNPPTLVIGVGNEFRGDDAVGLLAVRDLETWKLPSVQIVESRGDGARLMRLWKGIESVIVIDAVRSGSPPGTLHRLDVSHHPLPANFLCTSSHQFGVGEAIETSRELGDLPPRVVFYGVEIEHCVAGTPASIYDHIRERLLTALKAELIAHDPVATASFR